MDIVRRPVGQEANPVRPVSRQAPVVTPVHDEIQPAQPEDLSQPTPAIEQNVPGVSDSDGVSDDQTPDDDDLKAELQQKMADIYSSMDEASQAEPASDESASQIADTEKQVTEPEVGDTSEIEDLLSSPFIANAEVEKRPLGQPDQDLLDSTDSVSSDESDSPSAEVSASSEKNETESDATNVELSSTMTSELASDDTGNIDEIESAPSSVETPGDKTEATHSPEINLPPELSDEVLSAEAVDETRNLNNDQVDSIAKSQDSSPSKLPGSINQQYKEEPSTGDKSSGAIFDTSTYHKEVDASPAKKKGSALKIVILALVLLIIGAGAGVAFFYLKP